ncbi:major facilitator superfamily domain-containing protein [Lentinula edodes]|nr:major facilitator superfamily domain-containing protein [Lentinula edodes]
MSSSNAESRKSDSSLNKTASVEPVEVGPVSYNGEEYVQSSGVTRMEAIHRSASGQSGRFTLWAVSVSVVVCAWAYSLDQSTTSNYDALATSSFSEHSSGLASLNIATGIISSVCQPFIAKISDIFSRPYTYILVLAFYVVGYIIIATSSTISAYVVGAVFVSVGSSGLSLLNNIVVADLTTLEWRGFVNSLLSAPFIINTWYAGKIVNALSTGEKWRWGYGMFAIIMPVDLCPAIFTLIYLDRKAHREGIINLSSSGAVRRLALAEGRYKEQARWTVRTKQILSEIDAFGLILLGFGWSLLLLPFSLKTYAEGGWHNPSLQAMMVVGGVLLIVYVFYEIYVASVPSTPKRILKNKTFIMAVIIDFVYLMAGEFRDLYFSSYIYIVKDWSVTNWTYYNNTLTISLCVFGIFAGLFQRWTHRYKTSQIVGLCVKIIGIGILLNGTRATDNTAALILAQIIVGAGGAFSVVGSRVASQASVPHQDVALIISLLSLWSNIGGSIGAAIAAVIWSAKMPMYLREYLPANTTDTQIETFFGNIKTIRAYSFDSPTRQGAIMAYQKTLWYLIVPALGTSFIPLIAACFQTDYFLGRQQNAVMNIGPDGSHLDDSEEEETIIVKPTTLKGKFLKFWAGK